MGSCCRGINNFIWENQRDLTEFEHCKPAPFVSNSCLMWLRIFISASLLATAIAVIIITDWDSIKYFSEWALYGATILYALMAYVQVQTSKEVKDFELDDPSKRRQSYILDDIEAEVNTSNSLTSTNWKWIIFFYQMCFVCCLLASSVFWFTVIFYNETYDITGEHDFAILVSLHTIPSCLMIIEYPFNMIPWDWRFLPFNLGVMLLYLLDTVLFQLIQQTPVYNAMDWGNNGAESCAVFLGICLFMVAIFSGMLLLT